VDNDSSRRHWQLDGTRNLRDIGGYQTVDGRRTRWRTVFRSDCLDRLTLASQAQLLAAGLRTIVDLRERREILERTNVMFDPAKIAYRWLPFWNPPVPYEGPPDFAHGYLREIDERGASLVAICRELLTPGALPALIHCAAGKDRTGVVIGLLLAVARVEPELIAQDYALSAACLGNEDLEERRQWVTAQGWSWEVYSEHWDTPPERMTNTLEHLQQRWGGPESYLVAHGLTAAEVRALREALTEAPTA
jgi:protein-tyrosine phosphatase